MTKKPESISSASMGTMAWGSANAGELGGSEKLRLIGSLAYVQVREVFDTIRCRLGLLQPRPIDLDELLPPPTSLVADARYLAETTHTKALLFHSWRTYFFGCLLAAHEGIEYDRSLFFSAAILHDVGLTEGHTPHLCDRCFALSGGERANAYLREKGHSPQISQNVGDAISLHLNGWVSKKRHGAEAHLVSRGAFCDLFGAGRRRLAQTTLGEVLRRFPRKGVIEALQFETAHHCVGTRPAFMTALSGRKAPPDPF